MIFLVKSILKEFDLDKNLNNNNSSKINSIEINIDKEVNLEINKPSTSKEDQINEESELQNSSFSRIESCVDNSKINISLNNSNDNLNNEFNKHQLNQIMMHHRSKKMTM